jgi:hypothetical protein
VETRARTTCKNDAFAICFGNRHVVRSASYDTIG